MAELTEVIVGIVLVIGAAFALIASIGVLRFPDVYTRTHAASKAGTLGSGLMLVAICVGAGELDVITRGIAGAVFFLLTAPISSHLLARAAYCSGYSLSESTRINALDTSKIMQPADKEI